MFENEILDEGFLKELMLKELDIDIGDIEPVGVLSDEENTLIVRTFANPHEAKLFHKILSRVGIPSKIDTDPTMGNMDPLFNAGTQMLLTREEDVKKSLEIIEAVDRNFSKYRKEAESTDYTRFLFAAIIMAAIAILAMWFFMKSPF